MLLLSIFFTDDSAGTCLSKCWRAPSATQKSLCRNLMLLILVAEIIPPTHSVSCSQRPTADSPVQPCNHKLFWLIFDVEDINSDFTGQSRSKTCHVSILNFQKLNLTEHTHSRKSAVLLKDRACLSWEVLRSSEHCFDIKPMFWSNSWQINNRNVCLAFLSGGKFSIDSVQLNQIIKRRSKVLEWWPQTTRELPFLTKMNKSSINTEYGETDGGPLILAPSSHKF